MDTWQDVGHSLNLRIKLEQKGQKGEKDIIFLVLSETEKEGGNEKSLSFSLRSTELSWSVSVGPRKKVITSTRGMRGYLEREISPRIQERKFQEIKVFGFRRLPTRSSTLQEVWILPTLVYFPFLG